MKLVILESPYAGDVRRNVAYARACVRDSLMRGEAPIASHLLYTQPGILNDEVPDERQLGIWAGLAWRKVARAAVVYTDLGITAGMRLGIVQHEGAAVPVEYRQLGEGWEAAALSLQVRKVQAEAPPAVANERVAAGLIGLELEESGKLPLGTQLTRGVAIRLIMHALSSFQKRTATLTVASTVQEEKPGEEDAPHGFRAHLMDPPEG